jgi:hypothetical protein
VRGRDDETDEVGRFRTTARETNRHLAAAPSPHRRPPARNASEMLLPMAAMQASPLGVAQASTLLAVEVMGPQVNDIFYIGGVLVVLGFGGRQVFDSVFAESTDEYQPPILTPSKLLSNLPFIGSGANENPEEDAEDLRQRMMAAANAGDLETAYRLEKEMKNLLAESGVRFIVEDDGDYSAQKEEKLPDKW